MTKFNLEKCKSSNKGITLIALIITIIVLLILAGITISALTGSDSAPAKANEAKQKNDIGSAKDQLALLVQNEQTEAYDDIYVKGNNAVSLTSSTTTIGQRVITAAVQQYGTAKQIGDATMQVTQSSAGQNAKVTITTRDYKQEGTIAYDGGTLTWKALEDNNGNPPAGNTSTVSSLAQAGTIKVGDYVNYTPSSGSVTVTSAQTGHSTDQTFSTASETGMTWRVLSVDSTTGEVKIVGSPTTTQLTLYGKAGFGNAETVLNSIAEIFGGGTGAASVRSITEDDVFDAIGYNKVANYENNIETHTSGDFFSETWDSTTGTATYSTTTITATEENPITLHSRRLNPSINTASATLENGTIEEKANMQIIWDILFGGNYEIVKADPWVNYIIDDCFNYWCSSRFASQWGTFFVRAVWNGRIDSGYSYVNGGCGLYGSDESDFPGERGGTRSVVPVISLQSNTKIEQDTSANKTTWNFVTE